MDCNGNGLFVQEWMTVVYWRRRKLSQLDGEKSPPQLRKELKCGFCKKKDLFELLQTST